MSFRTHDPLNPNAIHVAHKSYNQVAPCVSTTKFEQKQYRTSPNMLSTQATSMQFSPSKTSQSQTAIAIQELKSNDAPKLHQPLNTLTKSPHWWNNDPRVQEFSLAKSWSKSPRVLTAKNPTTKASAIGHSSKSHAADAPAPAWLWYPHRWKPVIYENTFRNMPL